MCVYGRWRGVGKRGKAPRLIEERSKVGAQGSRIGKRSAGWEKAVLLFLKTAV